MKTPPFSGVTLIVFPSGPSNIFKYCIFKNSYLKLWSNGLTISIFVSPKYSIFTGFHYRYQKGNVTIS